MAKSVVLLPFVGPGGGAATTNVRKEIEHRFRLINSGQFVQAARREDLSPSTAEGMIVAAKQLQITAIIKGSIARLGGRWVLRLQVYSGHSGKIVGTRTVLLNGPQLDRLATQRAEQAIVSLVGQARAPTGSARSNTSRRRGKKNTPLPAVREVTPTEDQETETDTEDSDLVIEDAPDRTPRPVEQKQPPPDNGDYGFSVGKPTQGTTDQTAPNDVSHPASNFDTGFGTRKKAKRGSASGSSPSDVVRQPHPAQSTIFEAWVGLTLLNRSFAFNDPVDPPVPSDYFMPGVAPVISLQATFFPGAIWTKSNFAKNFGITGRFARLFGLQSSPENNPSVVITNHMQLLEGGVRYRWAFFDSPTSPELRFGADIGNHAFTFDDVGNQIALNDVSYIYAKFAILDLTVPFWRSTQWGIGGFTTFDYLWVFMAGDIERADSNGYGKATVGAIDIGLGITANYRHFFARISGDYRRYFYSFLQTCVKTNGCKHAGGAVDVYINGDISFGYHY